MDINQFTSKIRKPIPKTEVKEKVLSPEHPNSQVLEHMLVGQTKNHTELVQALDNLVLAVSKVKDDSLESGTLVKIADMVLELKGLREDLKQKDETIDIKLIIE